ncbi:DNA-binding GntR family transcriptional regulator [Paucimonas lemoignei]|uniref:DNA-binding GntR family transcriptional regulator n=1 Tax=Paucimonas lemoignei TaxID=29443 RepID=A0A4R3HYD8_PAULE|nr:GntR family transcriptional regulator [Paucimonas lemoignei]TCS38346.1 DNA-binding GntR family transcriptional regulator [Paucimonas lemoignei]
MRVKTPEKLFDREAVSQTEKAYVILEEMIVTGELPAGSQWSESVLGERIGIGRSPTRDALQKLAFQRLVHIAPRQGIFISEIDYQGQLHVIQCRREIERLIIPQATQCASEQERAEMTKLVAEFEKLKTRRDMRRYMRVHFDLTRVLGQASRNSYAAEFYAMLQTLARRFLYFHQDRYPSLAKICDLHIDQLHAIIDGLTEAAQAAGAARNDYAEERARNILMDLITTSSVTVSVNNRKP